MKVSIINPPAYENKEYIREGRCMQLKSSWAALWMPLSLAYLAAFLKKKGHQIQLIDCIAEKMDIGTLKELVKDFSPTMVVLNTAFPSIKGDMITAAEIKKAYPGTEIAIIGLYPTLLEKGSLGQYQSIDFGVVGEPEWVIKDLIKSLENNLSLEKIKGLIFRQGREIKVNQPQDLTRNNVNELPFPARDLFNNKAYRLPIDRKKFTLLSVGRGCPYNCSFCVANIYYGKKFRQRSVKSVLDEIEECVKKYNIKNFLFWGESFTLDPNYGEAICDEIIKRGFKIVWSTASRVDTLNQKLLNKMKLAGCVLLSLGIESTSQDVLDGAKKGINVAQIEKAVAMVKNAGIKSMGHFIFGLPGETKETAQKTTKFALASGVNYAQFYCAIPYPKTKLGVLVRKNNWLKTDDYSQYDLTKSVMRNETLTLGQVKKFRDRAYRKFYFRPKMFIQIVREVNSLKSFFNIFNFLKWIKPK